MCPPNDIIIPRNLNRNNDFPSLFRNIDKIDMSDNVTIGLDKLKYEIADNDQLMKQIGRYVSF
jgi:hypothetical protein